MSCSAIGVICFAIMHPSDTTAECEVAPPAMSSHASAKSAIKPLKPGSGARLSWVPFTLVVVRAGPAMFYMLLGILVSYR